MRVDYVEAVARMQLHGPVETHRQVRGHRRQSGNLLMAAKKYRRANNIYTVFGGFRREVERLRCEHGCIVAALYELLRQGFHHHPAAASERGIFIIAEKNSHFAARRKYYAAFLSPNGDIRRRRRSSDAADSTLETTRKLNSCVAFVLVFS